MAALLERYRRVLQHLVPRAIAWVGGLLALFLLLAGSPLVGALLAGATVAFVAAWRTVRIGADRHLVVRTALAAGLGVAIAREAGWSWTVLGVVIAITAFAMAEPMIGHATRPALEAHGLPGFRPAATARLREPVFLAGCIAVALLALGVAGIPMEPVAAIVGLTLLVGLAVAGQQLVATRRHAPEQAIRTALQALAPRYCLYFNGTPYAAYQVRMWLPYLQRTGESGVLVIRDPRFLPTALEISDLPVVLARSVESLAYVVVPSVGAVFYVNNDAKNSNGVRYTAVTHVHLGHGDSDKPASYAASTAMFDRIFVAGQAGVDRFAEHGVLVPTEKFELVGRPQVEGIEVRDTDAEVPTAPVVLYAPTWRGSLEDSLFGSLRAGERIVRALLAAGATVIFRPHPYSLRDAESRALITQIDDVLSAATDRPNVQSTASARLSIFDCINASDAMVTDISSVASDYLYSNKPFAITDSGDGDLRKDYRVARAATLLPLDATDLSVAVAELLGPDTLRAERTEVRTYYLGAWPPQEYPDVFVAAARAVMAGGPRP
jgi:hypothetical protein